MSQAEKDEILQEIFDLPEDKRNDMIVAIDRILELHALAKQNQEG